jgi:hypothetical protein
MIVFTATHSSSLSDEMVGRCRAGSSDSTAWRSGRFTLSIRPTRPCASIAALSSNAMFSIFVRLAASASADRLAMNWVLDSMTVSRMRNRFARSVEPVSVASTMASASTGGFTSVAPHENSTFTFTLCRSKYARVTRTSSVATVLPPRSAADRMEESSGAAGTQRIFPQPPA